jgi:RNA polymerase sigma-70 factor (ECF subfamily)
MEPVRREHPDDGGPAHGVNPSAAAPRRPEVPDAFLGLRPMLHALAYRMLGSVHDAEDVVQDAYLRWAAQDADAVANPAAFLTTVVTRLSLDRLRSAAARREVYVGPWLPEPLPTEPGGGASGPGEDPATSAALRESASLGMMLLLERLSPAERAVFVLREAFDVPYPQIGEILGRSPESCRQLHHRAGERLHPAGDRARRPTRRSDPARERRIVEGFLTAARGGDLDGLKTLLREDVVVLSDGGGKFSAARRPIHGAAKTARLFATLFPRRFADREFTYASFNHQPALFVDLPPYGLVYIFDVDEDGLISGVFLMANPDKLDHLGRVRDPRPR